MSSSSSTRSVLAAVPTRVEETIGIARPPETVWALVADPRNDPRWCRTVKSVDVIGERHWRVMHKPIPLRPPRELQLNQLAAEPPRRLVLRQEDAAVVFDVEYRLEPTQTGTRFMQVSQFAWKRLPLVLHGTFGRAVRREVRGQLRTLKALLEHDGAARRLIPDDTRAFVALTASGAPRPETDQASLPIARDSGVD